MGNVQTIYVVDDDRHVLTSLSALLEAHDFEVCAFESAERFLATVDSESVGCVIADLQMPVMDGQQLQRQLLTVSPALAVIVVTGYADVPTTVELMNRGAVTVIEKPYQVVELITAVTIATAKSSESHARIHRRQGIRDRLATLTEEEREIAQGMIAGTPIKALARKLRLSMRTVDRRRRSILSKMQADSVGELGFLCSKISLETTAGSDIRVDDPRPPLFQRMHSQPDSITPEATPPSRKGQAAD